MAIFVANLSFPNSVPSTDLAKLSIIIASLVAGILGSAFLIIEHIVEHRKKG